ncbi:hypothetical protein EV188_10260 [Actinomycetospora succinea]|uniref:Uncharacterized protein n=1 Tax=Actinomycetospora succinea TaxID=663603 RepID=A0A4R6VI00_9PSEU|nr:hypothetical protein [Actinomycetospora succinea]TDQ62406.1 hypothetical protein EV188_10260 [Actinomycetospora succinea]
MITNRDLDVIGLRDLDGFAAPARTASPDEVTYELLREVPPSRDGWSLLCRRNGRVSWSMPLAPRGAAPRVRPAVAQAVAVRVLTEQGVFVSGWNHVAGTDDVTDEHFVARRPHAAPILPV